MTIARLNLICLIGISFLVICCTADACILCIVPCPGGGTCISRPRSNGWSSCDLACQCPTPQQDCTVGAPRPLGSQVSCSNDFFSPKRQLLASEELTFGLSVIKTHSGTIILNVLRGSAAFRAGLRPGDKIIEINGAYVSRLSYGEITRLIAASAGLPISIVVKGTAKNRYSLFPETVSAVNARILESRSVVASAATATTIGVLAGR